MQKVQIVKIGHKNKSNPYQHYTGFRSLITITHRHENSTHQLLPVKRKVIHFNMFRWFYISTWKFAPLCIVKSSEALVLWRSSCLRPDVTRRLLKKFRILTHRRHFLSPWFVAQLDSSHPKFTLSIVIGHSVLLRRFTE